MRNSTYMDRALKSRDPRFARILSKLGYERRDMIPDSKPDELTLLRDEYLAVVGRKPFHGWDADALRDKIAAAREQSR